MDELKMMHQFINDYWKLVKQYVPTVPDWEQLHVDCLALAAKYNNHRFAQIHLQNLVEYLEDRNNYGAERKTSGLA